MLRSLFVLSFAPVVGALLSICAPAHAQPMVPYTSTGWTDFGTTNITGVSGNFMPGWTTISGSPDLGYSPFFIPVDTLSGAPNDAALWLLKFDSTHPGAGGNESAVLALDGFTPGLAYALDFSTTLIWNTFAGWNAPAETLYVEIIGADIPSWTSPILTDPIVNDNHNVWTSQTINFIPSGTDVRFRFNVPPVISLNPTLPARIGIDGISASVVPAPGVGCVLALTGAASARRRRR